MSVRHQGGYAPSTRSPFRRQRGTSEVPAPDYHPYKITRPSATPTKKAKVQKDTYDPSKLRTTHGSPPGQHRHEGASEGHPVTQKHPASRKFTPHTEVQPLVTKMSPTFAKAQATLRAATSALEKETPHGGPRGGQGRLHGHMGPGGETHEHDYGAHGKVKISPPQPRAPESRTPGPYGSGYSEHERKFGHSASHARGGMANAKKAEVDKHDAPQEHGPHPHGGAPYGPAPKPKKRHSPLDVDPSGKPRQSPYWQSPSGQKRGAEIESDWKRRANKARKTPLADPHGVQGREHTHQETGDTHSHARAYHPQMGSMGQIEHTSSSPAWTGKRPAAGYPREVPVERKAEKMNSEVAKAQAELRAATDALEKRKPGAAPASSPSGKVWTSGSDWGVTPTRRVPTDPTAPVKKHDTPNSPHSEHDPRAGKGAGPRHVATERFEWSHGKKPRGTGGWAFQYDDDPKPHFIHGSYADAKRQAMAEGRRRGASRIHALP